MKKGKRINLDSGVRNSQKTYLYNLLFYSVPYIYKSLYIGLVTQKAS